MSLCLHNLSVSYGQARVVHDVSFSVEPGQAVALVGRNGAGKSSVLNAIAGIVRSSGGQVQGTVTYNGVSVRGLRSHRIARLGIGWVPEDRRIFGDLTVRENLEVGRLPPRDGLAIWTEERLFDLFPNLAEGRDRPGGRLSGGEQQMLAVARTLMGNPSLILLDEPCEGLAPRIVEDMIAALKVMTEQGLTILMSEQSPQVAALICHRVLSLDRGRLSSQAMEGVQAGP